MIELDESAWLDRIERDYGVRLGPGQIYADRRGQVYAGSEYVATTRGPSPDDAGQWSDSIAHFPRGTSRLDTSMRCLGGGNPHTLCPCPRCRTARNDNAAAYVREQFSHRMDEV